MPDIELLKDLQAMPLDMKVAHTKQYEYCIGGGEYNEKGLWQPNKQGLGLGHCFDVLNEIYGKDFIVYK